MSYSKRHWITHYKFSYHHHWTWFLQLPQLHQLYKTINCLKTIILFLCLGTGNNMQETHLGISQTTHLS